MRFSDYTNLNEKDPVSGKTFSGQGSLLHRLIRREEQRPHEPVRINPCLLKSYLSNQIRIG